MFNTQVLFVGADPEVFLVDKHGKPISVEGKLGGTKYAPKQMEGLPAGYFIQEDNVAAEYNIPPARTCKQFDESIFRGLKYIEKQAKKYGLAVSLVDALHFDKEQLATPQAQTLGCEPDYNAWTGDYNPKPRPPENLRTAAGHVHVSFERVSYANQISFVKAFDIFATVPSLLVTKPSERRSLYGRSGACRLKDYGVECRSPSNFWLGEQRYRQHIFNTVTFLGQTLPKANTLFWEDVDENAQLIQDTINTHNIDGALEIMDKFQVAPFPHG